MPHTKQKYDKSLGEDIPNCLHAYKLGMEPDFLEVYESLVGNIS